MVGLRGLLRTGDGARGRETAGGAGEAIRRESAGSQGTERTPRGGGGCGRRGRVPGHDDRGVAPRIAKRVGRGNCLKGMENQGSPAPRGSVLCQAGLSTVRMKG